MRIAVAHENGEVFAHFGRTKEFKVYEVEDNKVVSSNVIGTDGIGHEALAFLLAEKEINVLICGGMGSGAQAALSEAGLEVYSGVDGDADEAVQKYLNGELESQGVNCNHHEEEEGGGCGGHCGSCGGCHHEVILEGKNAGKNVQVHYKGTFNDGTQFDSSYDRGEPLAFVCGTGMMIPGFDKAVVDMSVGEKKSIHLMPAEAYGEVNPNMIFSVSFEELPDAKEIPVGEKVCLTNAYGREFLVKVAAKTDTEITFDANNDMAGKELNFDIELVSVE